MKDGLNGALLLIEEDIKWLRNAAQHFENLTNQLGVAEQPKWALLAACYQERAGMHEALLDRLRDARQPTKSSIREKLTVGLGATW